MRAYLENKARKQREAMERKYGVGSLSGGGKLSSDGSYHAAPRGGVVGDAGRGRRGQARGGNRGRGGHTRVHARVVRDARAGARRDARTRRLRGLGVDPARVPAEGGGLRHRQARAPALVQPKLDQGRENQQLGAGR